MTQRMETVYKKDSKSGKHRVTITPERVTFKLAHNVTEEEINLLDIFQRNIVKEDIDLGGASFRGTISFLDGKPKAYLLTNNKKDRLTISMVDGFDGVKYSFKSKGE